MLNPSLIKELGLYTKNGLVYDKKGVVELPRADSLACEFDLVYAERLVKALKEAGYVKPRPD